jgi:hypothetical protein
MNRIERLITPLALILPAVVHGNPAPSTLETPPPAEPHFYWSAAWGTFGNMPEKQRLEIAPPCLPPAVKFAFEFDFGQSAALETALQESEEIRSYLGGMVQVIRTRQPSATPAHSPQ